MLRSSGTRSPCFWTAATGHPSLGTEVDTSSAETRKVLQDVGLGHLSTRQPARELALFDFWFPVILLPVGFGQIRTAKRRCSYDEAPRPAQSARLACVAVLAMIFQVPLTRRSV